MIVSISGKGGSGKTVLAALLLKALLEGKNDILAVDADPATNLHQVLGVNIKRTVGDIVAQLKEKIIGDELPPEVDKRSFLERLILETLVETEHFDLLSMGRIEAEGCYCLINALLADIVDSLSKFYGYVLMDMEAGLEHISRRTNRGVDVMLIVTDPSKMGFQTAERIYKLAQKVRINFGRVYVVGNMFPEDPEFRSALEGIGIEVAGIIPIDPNISAFNLSGRSLLEIPDNSPAIVAARQVASTIGLV